MREIKDFDIVGTGIVMRTEVNLSKLDSIEFTGKVTIPENGKPQLSDVVFRVEDKIQTVSTTKNPNEYGVISKPIKDYVLEVTFGEKKGTKQNG